MSGFSVVEEPQPAGALSDEISDIEDIEWQQPESRTMSAGRMPSQTNGISAMEKQPERQVTGRRRTTSAGKVPRHLNDITNRHWYETLTRIRGSLILLFGLSLLLALSLGVAMDMFFSVMMQRELSARVTLGILLVPLILLCTAVLADEMLELGLDAMSLPCFGLFRATATASVRHFCPTWGTRCTEICLIVSLELVPVLTGLTNMATFGGLVMYDHGFERWGYCGSFSKGYLFGCLLTGYILGIFYVAVHTYVGHFPHIEARTNVLWQCMGNLGTFEELDCDVGEVPEQEEEEEEADDRTCRRMPVWMTAVCMSFSLVMMIHMFWKSFAPMFIGLMLCTILLAMALKVCAPQLLGKAFWFFFASFVLLTVSLSLFTTHMIKVVARIDEHGETSFFPTALGPGALGYGANLSDNMNSLKGDNVSPVALHATHLDRRDRAYPICGTTWGIANMTDADRFNILDLAMLARASYATQDMTAFTLGAMFNGTSLEEFELVENQPDDHLSRSIVVDFPKQQVRAITFRGTVTEEDFYADLQLYASIALLQLVGNIFPVIRTTPSSIMEHLIGKSLADALFGDKQFISERLMRVQRNKKEANAKGYQTLIMGHSLGGAIAGFAAAKFGVKGIGFSAPGLHFQLERESIKDDELQYVFTNIDPGNDLVPKIDEQRGMIERIKCELSRPSCHSLVRTTCELWSKCGDPRGRDYRRHCSK